MKVELSKKDLKTISMIVAEKAVQMKKKGQLWMRGNEHLSCVDIGKIANKLQKPLGSQWDFKSKIKNKI
jgi:hypothetical protein